MSPSLIQQVLDRVSLPQPIAEILENNLSNQVFQHSGLNDVNDYVSNSLVAVAISILSFIICFVVAYFLLSLLVSLIHHVFRLPLLKQLDWLAGGVLGLLRGGLLLYIIFLIIPVLSTIIPLDAFDTLLAESALAPIFQSNGFFASVIAGKL